MNEFSDDNPTLLSKQEVQILKLVCLQRDNGEIADLLSISQHTVLRHKQNIKNKIGAKSLVGFLTYALKFKYVELDELLEANLNNGIKNGWNNHWLRFLFFPHSHNQ